MTGPSEQLLSGQGRDNSGLDRDRRDHIVLAVIDANTLAFIASLSQLQVAGVICGEVV